MNTIILNIRKLIASDLIETGILLHALHEIKNIVVLTIE